MNSRVVRFISITILGMLFVAIVGLPLVTDASTTRRVRVPILMYHHVSDLPSDADRTRKTLTIAPDSFLAEMQYLKDNGYTVISLYELYDSLTNNAALPPNPIVLTFDDGYEDAYQIVFPILQQFGFTATFFIITKPVDGGDSAYMSWDQIHQMSDADMSMEAHTQTHPDLRHRNADFLVNEIGGSLDDIAAHTGQQPHMFAYPSGMYDANTLKVLRTLPVWLAVTTRRGSSESSRHPLELPRVRISPHTSIAGFAGLLKQYS
ncbi:MAG: polysaccharide deacetylase family protein [Chloroflexota bacterium]